MAGSKKKPTTFVGKIVALFGSFGLASALIFLLFLLTWLGTLAQTEAGIYEVQKRYFESWFVVHPITAIGRTQLDFTIPLPLPGGALVMGLFTLNLLIGGLVRIRKSSRTAGIIVVHIGILMMMAAALVKLTASADGHLTLEDGQQADEFVSYHDWEVAIWPIDSDSPGSGGKEIVVTHQDLRTVREGGETTFECAELPFSFTLSRFEKNARPVPKGPMFEAKHPVVEGWTLMPEPLDETAERNLAGLYVEVPRASGEPDLGMLFGAERFPWTIERDGRSWAMTLRHTRFPMPYAIRLEKFTRELHPRTGIAKVYSSRVTQIDEDGLETELDISMNEPLRAGGLVLFQSSFGEAPDGDLYSVFSVVRNPSDHWPLYSCIVIAIGLLLAFTGRLLAYMRQQRSVRMKMATGQTA